MEGCECGGTQGVVDCGSERDAGGHSLEEHTGGMVPGDGDKVKVGDTEEDCELGRVVGVCESGEKGRQEDDDKTKRRHRISNRDGKMEGSDQTGENMQGM